MSVSQSRLGARLGSTALTATAGVIGGVWRSRSVGDIEDRLAELPAASRAGVVLGVLGFVFLCSLFAAQFGIFGLLLYWLAVILLVN